METGHSKYAQLEKITVKGVHTLVICDGRSDKAQEISEELENVRIRRKWILDNWALGVRGFDLRQVLSELHDQYLYWLKRLHKSFKLREACMENITTTVGRSVLAQRLGGDNTYTGNIAFTALGSDVTAEVVGNTILGTETYRKALSSGADSNNIAYIETFFTASEVSGTFEEYGHFIDGSGTADTGQLFNRWTGSTTKSVTETMNVQSIITFADA